MADEMTTMAGATPTGEDTSAAVASTQKTSMFDKLKSVGLKEGTAGLGALALFRLLYEQLQRDEKQQLTNCLLYTSPSPRD